MKIKIFERDNVAGLERMVNTWLESDPTLEIVHIVQTMAPRERFFTYLMTVAYRERLDLQAQSK